MIRNLAEQDKQVNKSLLCKLFGVMKSSYYYGMQPISLETVKTKALIRQIFNDSKQSAGARSIVAILMNEHNLKQTRYIAIAGKLMVQVGLKICQLKTHKYKRADEAYKTHNNILARNFSPSTLNQFWTGDITYIRIKGGFS